MGNNRRGRRQWSVLPESMPRARRRASVGNCDMEGAPEKPVVKKSLSQAQFLIYQADFDSLDTNSNGYLDKSEVKVLFNIQLETEPDDTALTDFINTLDSDKDGKVNLREYIQHILGIEFEIKNNCAGCEGSGHCAHCKGAGSIPDTASSDCVDCSHCTSAEGITCSGQCSDCAGSGCLLECRLERSLVSSWARMGQLSIM